MWGNQSYQGPMSEWLMVAEKPAIAKAIADALSSNGRHTKERSPVENCNIPVYTFDTQQLGHLGPARVRVTSTVGHIYGLDFSGPYRKWGCDPADLFYAPTEKIFAGDAPVKEHLETVAASCNMLMLWLDCDREGENICFEVMDAVLPRMKPDYSDNDRIWRSRFSSLAPQDLRNALQSLVKPDQMQSQSVDARQVIDLKVGVALTRLLTGGLRESARGLVPETGTRGPLISYGPCQGPTLGFVVNRYEEIMRFQTEKSSTLDLHVMNAVAFWRSKPNREGLHVHSERHLLEEWANNCSEVRILGNNRPREERLERPVALNTVAMLKAASIELGFDPHYALECAEKLYLQGALTYPRTESTHYPPAQDLRWLVSQFVGHPEVGWWAQELQTRFADPQWGYDAGDHPPIMPVKYANVDGDLGKLYVMVVRHFLASVSPDLLYRRHDAKFEAHGEKFALSGQELFDKGWANIVTCKQKFLTPAQVELCTAPAQTIQCWATLRQVKTSPPQLLTEADLLSLMESNEVGTDASMSTHIKNISTRGYVEILNGRKMRPTHLGCQLIAGLRECDPELVNPEVRARIERDVLQVARGQQTQEQVVNDALEIFSAKFQEVRRNLRRIEQLIRMPPRPLVGGDHMENQPGYGKGGFSDGNWQPGAYDKGGFGKGGKNDGKGRPGPYDKGGFGGKGGFRDKGGFDNKGGFGNQGGFGGKGGFGDKGGFGGKGGFGDKGGFGGKGGYGDKGGYGKGGGGGYNNTGGYGKGGGGGYNDSGGFGKGFNNGYNDNKGGFAKGGNGKGSGYNNDKGYGGRKGGVGKSSSGKGYGDQSKGGYGAGYGSNAGGGNGSAWPPPPQARSAPYNSAGGGFGQYGAGAWTGDAGEGATGDWIGDAGQAATGGWTEESGQVATSGWTGEAGQAAMGDWAGDADAYGGGEKNVSLAQEKADYQGGMQGMRPVPGRQESATLASMSGGIAGMRRIGT